jgi:tetratricopeptide (TPR) repeat protein
VLRDAFERARHGRTPQLVTLVGVPGIGKSRLVYELSRIADADPDIITWRQGRCLAYGEGVTLWALGEIVKAQAGIVEQDTPEGVEAKVAQSVRDAPVGPDDETWVTSHLLRLVGLGDESELGGDRRGEAFAAWRRYLEALAEQRPLVLVFEDLHWADETLLDFVDELVDWVTDVPLLVVGTARPELLERRPAWGGGKVDATTLGLAPLTDEETAQLLSRLLERTLLEAESQQSLLERTGGNPLYAEQFVDLYLERGSTEELPLPETLHGIIAARLDGLPEAEKGLLRDASVVGKVFWQSALGNRDAAAGPILHSLERKGFVRRQRRSSLEGEGEFAFAHALVRDVAYGQIARAERAEKHQRVAQWIEALGRLEDHAEMLAYHYATALDLIRAAGGDVEPLTERPRAAFRAAGDRAFSLNAFTAAAAHYEQALALSSEDDPDRPALLLERARALVTSEDADAIAALEEARDALLATDDREGAGGAEALLAQALWYRGEHDDSRAHLAAARELVDAAGPSVGKTRVLAVAARSLALAGEGEESLRLGREALAMAETLSLAELQVHCLTTIGQAKGLLGDPQGEKRDLERALEVALSANSPEAARVLNNLAVDAFMGGDVRREHELFLEAREIGERFGDRRTARFVEGNLVFTTWALGQWDDALARANAFIADCESGSPHYMEDRVRGERADIRLARGHVDEALEEHRRGLELARQAGDLQSLAPALTRLCRSHLLLGQVGEARPLAEELLSVVRAHPGGRPIINAIADFADELGIHEDARELMTEMPETPWKEAIRALLDGDFVRAADVYASTAFATREAEVRLEAAERLIQTGRRPEGEAQLEQALAFYRSVGATFFLERGEQLLAATA